MRLLMRFMKPYRGLIAVTLLVLLVDNVGTLLVPTMLANMVNTGITTGDVDYILRNGLYMFIATGMASGGAVLGCYLSARLAANVACDIRNAVYDKSLELSASDFERFGTGSMITRSLNDINVIQQAILQTIQLVLPVPFLAVAGIIFAWLIDPAMGTLLGVVVAIVLVAAVFTVANAAPIFMRLQGFIDRMNVVCVRTSWACASSAHLTRSVTRSSAWTRCLAITRSTPSRSTTCLWDSTAPASF